MIRAILTSGSMRSLRHKPDRSCAPNPGHISCQRQTDSRRLDLGFLRPCGNLPPTLAAVGPFGRIDPRAKPRSGPMAANDRSFVGPIPEIYDRCLVPLLFEPYARDLAERVAATRPRSVWETAVGTGVLTRALAARLPAEARIAATDLNPAKLDHAKARQSSDDRITWQPADALALPFRDGGFDVVACQFGAMFFPDKVQGYREARRVLSPDRRFMFNVWDRISENDFAQAVTDALADRFPGDPPRFMARVPHGYFDLTQIREDLSR